MAMVAGILVAPATPAAAADTYEELIANPDLHEGHSQVLRLYRAVLARQPEVGGAEFWLRQYDLADWSTRRIADFFVNSDEFKAVFGDDLDDLAFTTVVYDNVLDRAPDGDGFDFWVGELVNGMERSEMVLLISNSPEFINRFPLPGDARFNAGPLLPGLGFFLSTQEICNAYATQVGNPVPNPVRFEDARQLGPAGGSGEYIILDGLGDQLFVSLNHASGSPVIFSANGQSSELPFDYSFGCPPDLYLGTLSS